MSTSSISLGLGVAKVTVEITRPDATVDVLVIDSIVLSDASENGIEVYEEDPPIGHPIKAFFTPSERTLTVGLSGDVLAKMDNGAYVQIRTDAHPKLVFMRPAPNGDLTVTQCLECEEDVLDEEACPNDAKDTCTSCCVCHREDAAEVAMYDEAERRGDMQRDERAGG